MPAYYQVGTIVNTQGLKGDVRVLSITDFKEKRYTPGEKLLILRANASPLEVKITSHRTHKQFEILHFAGYDTLEAVLPFKDAELGIPASQREDELAADTYYYDDIIGLSVYDEEKNLLGTIIEIENYPAHDIWVMEKLNTKERVLLPVVTDVVKEIHLEAGQVVIYLLEGLMP